MAGHAPGTHTPRRTLSVSRALVWAALLIAAVLLARPAVADEPPQERFSWFGGYFGSGMLPWFQQPRGGFNFGGGHQQGPGFVAVDISMGAGPVAGMPMAIAYGQVLGGVVAGVAGEGEARPFAGGRIVGGFVVSDAFDPYGIPAPHFRFGGSVGLMVRPGGRPFTDDPHAHLTKGRPGGRLSLEPSFAILPVAGLFGFTLELKFAALIW